MKKKVMILLLIAIALLAGLWIIHIYLPFGGADRHIENAKPGKADTVPAKPGNQAVAERPFDPEDKFMEVNYRGLKFWVDKANPVMNEIQARKIEEIIMTDKPPEQFEKNTEMNAYYLTLKAPGQNGSTGGFTHTSIGVLTSFCVQAPYKPMYRFLVYRADTEKGPWEQYADFIYQTPSFPRIGFDVRGDELVCFDQHRSNKVMHVQTIPRKQP